MKHAPNYDRMFETYEEKKNLHMLSGTTTDETRCGGRLHENTKVQAATVEI